MDYPKSVPGVGLVDGKFVDENQVTGEPGSLIPAAWGNAVTAEIMAVISGAGLSPSEGDNEQLRQAISGLIGKATVDFGLGSLSLPLLASVNDQAISSGLYRVAAAAIGLPIAEPGFVDIRREDDGKISQRYYSRTSDRAFFRRANGSFGPWLEKLHAGNLGSATEMATGTSTSKPPSIAAVMSLFAKRSFAADDFVRIPDVPGGLIVQWGRSPNVAADATREVIFPVAFPNACRGMLACLQSAVAGTNPVAVYAAPTSLSAGQVVRDVATSPYAAGEIVYLAFGN
ncbi:pyocin knob domain-containing protein [Stutzerimonas decontaminans]|uniref:Putative tail fiber protein gp53-like C-terminal domain-containing protein n=1 Tax=Stutzerimonas stutzeri TaxID=316 RepID=A0A023WY29_STUST|nr:pyocin knob domain-containing protein [Stutzerimonas decontaminans]AHY45117.1 hypothetical protein UIB01_15535 [Stutzerimonas decontaminans]